MFIYCDNKKVYETDLIMFTNGDGLKFTNKETGKKEEISQETVLSIAEPENILSNEKEEPEKKSILIDLDGGCVQNVYSKEPINVMVLDYDIDGADDDELMKFEGDEMVPSVWDSKVNPKRITSAFKEFEKGEKETK